MNSCLRCLLVCCGAMVCLGFAAVVSAEMPDSLKSPSPSRSPAVIEDVRNVRFWVEDQRVHVGYDLVGQAQYYRVELYVSGGPLTQYAPRYVVGDIGKRVRPGPNRKIVWDALRDLGQLEGEDFVFEVRVARGGRGIGKWVAGSSVATVGVTAAVLYLTREKHGTIVLDVPDPKER